MREPANAFRHRASSSGSVRVRDLAAGVAPQLASSCVSSGRRPRVDGPWRRGTPRGCRPHGARAGLRRASPSASVARPLGGFRGRSPGSGGRGRPCSRPVGMGSRRATWSRSARGRGVDDRAEALLEAELAPVLADQVDHGEMALALRAPQAAPELLGEDRRRGRRAQQQQRSRRRARRRPRRAPRRRTRSAAGPPCRSRSAFCAYIGRVVAGQRDALQSRLGELPRHVVARAPWRRRSRAPASRRGRARCARFASSSLANADVVVRQQVC